MLRCVILAAIAAALAAVEHPFILWNAGDLAAIRARIAAEPWAKAAADELVASTAKDGAILRSLFRYAVLGDEAAGQRERQALLAWTRAPDPLGGACEFNVLRYDLCFALLTADERAQVQARFRRYLDYSLFANGVFDPALFNDEKRYSRYDQRDAAAYGRANWLPNIIFPRKLSANLMALALRDEALVRRCWEHPGSIRWYLDRYLADSGFYCEEFSKMGATPGALLLWCRGAERLGLDALGFGYRGAGGATIRGHLESLIRIGYPAVDLGGGRPHIPRLTAGDIRGGTTAAGGGAPVWALQQHLVMGFLPDGSGGNELWRAHGAWGGTTRGNSPQWDNDKTEKMQLPLWFEIAHARWPDAGFGWFLAQMRRPGQERYLPTLHFGCPPVDPAQVAPPPAPSAVFPGRGLAMLRAEESPAYWTSPAPAVGMRLATAYAHRVDDAFALCGFYGLGRPLYLNRHVTRGYAEGWSRGAQSHCGLMVDDAQPGVTDAVAVRFASRGGVRFLAATSAAVLPDVQLTRSLLLTRDYLVDAVHAASPRPRTWSSFWHALGDVADRAAWTPAGDGALPWSEFTAVRRRDAGVTWSTLVVQDCRLGDVAASRLGAAWYARRVGVALHALAEPGATAFAADTPVRAPPAPGQPADPPDECGGTSLIIRGQGPALLRVVVHEPCERGASRLAVRELARSADGVALAITGPDGIDDRVVLAFADRPLALAAGDESFAVDGWAWLRVGAERVIAEGGVAGLRLRSTAAALELGGAARPARREGALLVVDGR